MGRARERGAFQVPVYARPDDLITSIAETERARFNDRNTGFRDTPQGQVPYYTRDRDLERGTRRTRARAALSR